MIWKNISGIRDLVENIRQNTYHRPTFGFTSMTGDPFHFGHLSCVKDSARLCDILIVGVNNNSFLEQKKGFYLLDEKERLDMVSAIDGVAHCFLMTEHTCSRSLREIKPDYFFKGGDRSKIENLDQEEVKTCIDNRIRIVLGVGKNKTNSSSEITRKAWENYEHFREKVSV